MSHHVSKSSLVSLALLIGLAVVGCGHRPSMLASLPERYNTPDGMRMNPQTGEIVVACPNFNDQKHPGVLMKITKDNKVEHFADLPAHPLTGKAGPMGVDFGPDGNLYVADNQYFFDKEHRSRLIRVNIVDGKAVGAEVVVEGFKLSNAVMWKGNAVYVSDTFFDLPDRPGMSGIYRFTLEELRRGTVKLAPKGQSDPHLIATFTADAGRRGEIAGADGICFDTFGNLYTGNFGDGVMYKVTFDKDGAVKSNEVFVRDPKLTCVDGLVFDAMRQRIYVADSQRNAIRVVTLDGKVRTLWENGDTNGAEGLLDQPCEPLIRGNELIIANFDMPVPGMKNTKYDAPNTISVIRLK